MYSDKFYLLVNYCISTVTHLGLARINFLKRMIPIIITMLKNATVPPKTPAIMLVDKLLSPSVKQIAMYIKQNSKLLNHY